MSVLADVQEYLAGHLPAGSRLVINSNARRPFSDAESQQLHGAELRLPDSAVPARIRDFTRGRPAAHETSQRLGESAPGGIDMSTTGAPLWPRGVAGSISHCDGAVATVSANAEQLQGAGTDVEVEQTLELGIIDAVLRADEARLNPLAQFNAREPVYRLWEPMVGQWLDSDEVSVQPRKKRMAARGFSRGLEDGPLQLTFHREIPDAFLGVQDFWSRGAGAVVTAVWLEQP